MQKFTGIFFVSKINDQSQRVTNLNITYKHLYCIAEARRGKSYDSCSNTEIKVEISLH